MHSYTQQHTGTHAHCGTDLLILHLIQRYAAKLIYIPNSQCDPFCAAFTDRQQEKIG